MPGDDFDRLCEMFLPADQPNHRTDSVVPQGTPLTTTPGTQAFGDYFQPGQEIDATCLGSSLASGCSLEHNFNMDVEASGFTNHSNQALPADDTMKDDFAGFFQPTPPFSIDEQMSAPNMAWPTSLVERAPVAQMTVQNAPHETGPDCTLLALRIVSEMHVATQTCSSADPSAMRSDTHESASDKRDMSSILKTNRSAMRRINRILDCPTCSTDFMCLQTCHLAVQKAVAWYEGIVSLGCNNPGPNARLANLVRPQPIFLGSFPLDRDAHRVVRSSVIMGEVRDQVQPLITKLSGLQRAVTAASGADVTIQEGSSSSTATSTSEPAFYGLRQQIARIMTRASTER